MTTLTEKARGPFLYSMLDGDALTAVELVEIAEFAIEGGENLIFNVLEARYPDKDPGQGLVRCARSVGKRRRTSE